MDVSHYRDLIAWQKAVDFADAVYRLTKRFPRNEQFALTNQVRRAAVSVASNIAEGQGRASTREFVQFLSIARGSLQEAETQLVIASRLGYIDEPTLADILKRSDEVSRVCQGLSRSLKRRL